MFHSFTQVHSMSDENYGGTGLGLSICKQLVELMGGRIWLDESSESGTTFIFEIRLPFHSS
jgi:signal transduction histidine kinase